MKEKKSSRNISNISEIPFEFEKNRFGTSKETKVMKLLEIVKLKEQDGHFGHDKMNKYIFLFSEFDKLE